MSEIVHAGLIALHDRGSWRGVLIEGPSGAGKSDLALRALDHGFRLVADDRVLIWTSQGRLYGAAPPAIAGLMEARGVGITAQPTRSFVEIQLIARCVGPTEPVERMPDETRKVLLGLAIPTLGLRPFEASAPLKLIQSLSLLGGGR